MANLYGIILAGGKGERLWPLSRELFPKQLLSLSQKSLLEHTRDRIAALIPAGNISVVTTQQQAEVISKLFDHAASEMIIEPLARNTGPALLLSCLTFAKKDPDALMLFFPADHYVADVPKFIDAVKKALEYSSVADAITLIGIKPTYPATGFGYIEYQQSEGAAPKILQFHEKPSLEHAQRYIQADSMLWNIGIFCGKVSVFINEFKRLAPELFEGVNNYFLTGNLDSYYNLESISVDYALMEKSDALLVVPADFAWSDVGNLATFLSLHDSESNQSQQIAIETHNNLVMTKTLTVLIGVHDLCIVQTDDVLLISQREDVEKVKLAVNELKKNNLEKYL